MADKIQGIFSVEKTAKIGTGSTEKKVKQQMYCQAIEKEDGQIEVRYLGKIMSPLMFPNVDLKMFLSAILFFSRIFLKSEKLKRRKKLIKRF